VEEDTKKFKSAIGKKSFAMLGNLFHFQLKKDNQELKAGGVGGKADNSAKVSKADKKKAEKEKKEKEKEEKTKVRKAAAET
jgi:hypothetical protein